VAIFILRRSETPEIADCIGPGESDGKVQIFFLGEHSYAWNLFEKIGDHVKVVLMKFLDPEDLKIKF
jgi:hypothetical protein